MTNGDVAVKPAVYYAAAKSLWNYQKELFVAVAKLLKDSGNGGLLGAGGMAGDYSAVESWSTSYADTANDAIATITAFANAVNHYAEVVAETGYVWDMSEYNSNTNATKGTAPTDPVQYKSPEPTGSVTVPNPTQHHGIGLATELPGLIDALTVQVPNGDTDALDHAASSWEVFAADKTITEGRARLKQIEATFENTRTPEIENIRSHFGTLGKAVVAISDAVTALGKGVRTYHDDLTNLRNQMRADAASELSGLIKKAEVQPTLLILEDDGILVTDATTTEGKHKIARAAKTFSADIADSELLKNLPKPAFAPVDTSAVHKTLTAILAIVDPKPDPAPSKSPTPTPGGKSAGVTVDQIMAIYPQANRTNVAAWLPEINSAMANAGITTPRRKAAFLAEMGEETANFQTLTEYGDDSYFNGMYSPPKPVSKQLGNIKADDGARFRGRGGLQLTGRNNYTEASKALGVDFVNHPELVADPKYAFTTAAWYWTSHDLNTAADNANPKDADSIDDISRGINGGPNGQQVRRDNYIRACKVMGCA
jgi:putative chitinase